MAVGTPTLTVEPPSSLSESELKRWKEQQEEREYQEKLQRQRESLEPAYFSSSAAKVQELLAAENVFAESLYKVYELAEGHPDHRAVFHREFDISREDFDRFRDAVHNPVVSGG